MELPALKLLGHRLRPGWELHARTVGYDAFDRAEAVIVLHAAEQSGSDVTPSEVFLLMGVDPEEADEVFRSSLAIQLLGLETC